MIALTPKDKLEHVATWHAVDQEEGRRLCKKHANLLAQDLVATRVRLIKECVRAKLGVLPQPEHLADRLSIVGKKKVNWVTLDGEAIAIYTDFKTDIRQYRYVLSWYFKSLVDTSGN